MDNNVFESSNYSPTPEPTAGTPLPPQEEKPVHTGIFFGLEVLFSLPLIGLIASIIFSFAPQNKNLKNYARAKMIWCIIYLLLTVLMIVSCVILTQKVTEYLESKFALDDEEKARIESLLDTIDNIGELAGMINGIGSSDGLADIIGRLGGMENIGELIGQVGDMENIDEIIEAVGGIENIEEIIEQAGGIENFGEIVDAVGGMENISGIDSIEDIKEIAEQIEDPEVKDRIMDIIRQNDG